MWVLFRRVVPPTEVMRPQGGGRRRAGDREPLASLVFVATSGCTWRQSPPVFGASWQTVSRRIAQWSRSRACARPLPRSSGRAGASGDGPGDVRLRYLYARTQLAKERESPGGHLAPHGTAPRARRWAREPPPQSPCLG
ncbi:transposase [Streptomyces sp. ISL-87]|uniref:transposase n=1 Tax=unclassified Streptomyces TaxID=2593676 RepID=UPI0035AB7746